ncbi:MAG: hypothetical protein C0602_06060 [Denitrovibrio sp.]|nr:MAG: hypothetical protein C0602_06060 [Denitrovibrio sp.]
MLTVKWREIWKVNKKYLESIWSSITYSGENEFEFLRIDAVAIPELHLGLKSNNNRCLLLELPKNNALDFRTTIKKNLTLSMHKNSAYLVLELTNNLFRELFNDLVISIYTQIYQLSDVDEYSRLFIRIFYKWSEFFENNKHNRLSAEEIIGLFGELYYLSQLIISASVQNINNVLLSWRGPYGNTHDFVLDKKHVEIKTRMISTAEIKISSEYQLEPSAGKRLELVIVLIDESFPNGDSISTVLQNIKYSIQLNKGDFSIVLDALSKNGVTTTNATDYDNYRFEVIRATTYNCDDINFPKLTRSGIPEAVVNAKYSLMVDKLAQYIISEEIYE